MYVPARVAGYEYAAIRELIIISLMNHLPTSNTSLFYGYFNMHVIYNCVLDSKLNFGVCCKKIIQKYRPKIAFVISYSVVFFLDDNNVSGEMKKISNIMG